jgi:ornithine cyclodeaminase/alanine dehydrogenase-like protein (mu-crystallin family)
MEMEMANEILYLSEQDVAGLNLPAEQMLGLAAEVLQQKHAGRTEMPPKFGVHPRPQSFLHAMPGYLEQQDSVGLKLVSYYPGNPAHNCATINAMMLLNDAATGQPLAVMDGNWITAYRTATVSALSCKLLAVNSPKTLGLIGYGIQAESHLELLMATFPLTDVQVWGPRSERCTAFAEQMDQRFQASVTAVVSAEEAVRDKDIVISVTPIGVPPIQQLQHGWLRPGAIICPVEFDSAWDKKTFQQAGIFVTDDIVQFDQYRHKGFFKEIPTPEIELADLVNNNVKSKSDGISVAVNLGVGLMDIAFAKALYDLAQNKGIGHMLPR